MRIPREDVLFGGVCGVNVGQLIISNRRPIISQNAGVAQNIQDLSTNSTHKCNCGQDRQSHNESLNPRKSAGAECKVTIKIRKVFLCVLVCF
jgi:hypothetical protein